MKMAGIAAVVVVAVLAVWLMPSGGAPIRCGQTALTWLPCR